MKNNYIPVHFSMQLDWSFLYVGHGNVFDNIIVIVDIIICVIIIIINIIIVIIVIVF